ncbi:MAG: hypothetical protein ACKPH3_26705 [Dolichospermum sp.]
MLTAQDVMLLAILQISIERRNTQLVANSTGCHVVGNEENIASTMQDNISC